MDKNRYISMHEHRTRKVCFGGYFLFMRGLSVSGRAEEAQIFQMRINTAATRWLVVKNSSAPPKEHLLSPSALSLFCLLPFLFITDVRFRSPITDAMAPPLSFCPCSLLRQPYARFRNSRLAMPPTPDGKRAGSHSPPTVVRVISWKFDRGAVWS